MATCESIHDFPADRASLKSESPLASDNSAYAVCIRTAKLTPAADGRMLSWPFKETAQISHDTQDFWSRVVAFGQYHSLIVVILASLLLMSFYFTATSIVRHPLDIVGQDTVGLDIVGQDMDCQCENECLGGSARSLRLEEGFNSTDDLRGCILMIDSRFGSSPSALLGEVSKQLRYVEEFHQQSAKGREKLEALVKEASYYSAARTINWYA